MRKVNLNIAAAFFVLITALAGPAGAVTWYVDPNGSKDFTTIQAAIDDPCTVDYDEIEVAPGTYYEAINFSGKAVRLYSSGGADVTTIDGTGNYHVVQCVSGEDANTILEGFTITGASANGPWPNDCGGGMYNNNSSPTIISCTFSGNWAGSGGGGMYNNNSNSTVIDCIFSGNTSASIGGGMYNDGNSNPTVTECTFSVNTSTNNGGGMCNLSNSSPTVTDCNFTGNSASFGCGIYNENSSPAVTYCTFSNNNTLSGGGGGMYNYSNSSPTVTDCTFSGNQGSGIENYTGSSPTVTNCSFTGNWAYNGGGMRNFVSCSPTVTGCTFSGNSADIGGGMNNYNNSSPTVTNCTFSGNTADYGGGMCNQYSSSPTVTNCILWGNTPDEIYNSTSTPIVTYSDVEGGYGGTGNIDADPVFLDAANGDLRLCSCSPCVDGGDNSAVPAGVTTDPDGNPRFADDANVPDTGIGTPPIVDIGAYERQISSFARVCNVTKGVWYCKIQTAIDDPCTVDGDEIEVAAGTYYEAINFNGKAVRLYSIGGPEVTIIDSNGIAGAYHVVQCATGEDANTILEGFTITGGDANGTWPDDRGGGMYNYQSSPTVTDCIFTGNTAAYGGGGMGNENNSNPMVTNCTFSGNTADTGGGGIGNVSSNPMVTNCILWDDTPDEIYDDEGSSTNATYSDVGGGWGGTGNIDADPCFVDAAGGDFRLSSDASPCVDTGDNNTPGLPVIDLAGNPRVVDGDLNGTATVDMGAFEFQTWLIHNINKDQWYETIQAAIDDADYGDEIEVGPGTYCEAINFNGRAVRLYSIGGPEVTTIDGTGHYHVVQCISGEGANTILEGFTITGGDANGSSYPNNCGGGMLNSGSSPTLTNCTFNGNSAQYGGGMCNVGSSPTVTNCTISGNTAFSCGGMYNTSSSPTIINCTFSGNSAAWYGGMVNYDGSSPTVTDSTFTGNTADQACGGMHNNRSSPKVTNCTFSNNTGNGMTNYSNSPTVTNCTFSNNTFSGNGGGMNNQSSSLTLTNCTFSGNSAGNNGGGIYNQDGSLTVTNCILWDDAPDEIYISNGTATVSYSDIQGGGYPDANNINADPCFIDAVAGDLRLGPDSPCIDDGNNVAVPSSILKDLAGKLRFADDPYTSDTGDDGDTGRPVVDMGAYEFQGCGAIPQNLLANPGFETGDATGWMANWGLAADTNQAHEGDYSGLASGRTSTWDGAWQSVLGLMDDGKTYRISGWVMLQNADSDYVQLTVKKTDLGGTNFYFIDSATGSDDQWVHLDGTLALDVNGQPTELFVYFEGPAADVNFFVDDASVTEVTGDMNHNGGVDFFDFSLFASYYRFDCSTQDCGLANLYDCDKAINERDLAILVRDWLVGTEP